MTLTLQQVCQVENLLRANAETAAVQYLEATTYASHDEQVAAIDRIKRQLSE